ncbi:MAG: hypothetical protein IT165_07115, partial [Bryobacterales bacterium]|nr:hypothetical protein [Bryobacterales bacterium]
MKGLRESSPISNVQIVSKPGLALGLLFGVAAFGAAEVLHSIAPAVVLGLSGLYLLFAIKVAQQWEKCAVLRLGKYIGLRGPGMFHIIPVVDSLSKFVDQRVSVNDVRAETALTSDTVPVNVDAIVFWLVWDAQKALLEVQDFVTA